MSKLTDDELTKLAIEELLRDAKRFKDKRDAEFRATQIDGGGPLITKGPMKHNRSFLKNTLRDVLSFNAKKQVKSSSSRIMAQPKIKKVSKEETNHKIDIIDQGDLK